MRWIPIALAIVLPATLILSLGLARSSEKGIPDSGLGLAKGSVFDTLEPAAVNENASDPGERPTIPRAHPEAPPAVPHGIADFLPIGRDENPCVDCHGVQEKEEGEPTPIPPSHFVDLRNAPGETGAELVGARYLCVTCHVPLSEAEPLVGNAFRP